VIMVWMSVGVCVCGIINQENIIQVYDVVDDTVFVRTCS
jgi:hypothetical protein